MKRKAIQKLVSLSLAGVLAMGLMTGCGDSGNDTGSSESGQESSGGAESSENKSSGSSEESGSQGDAGQENNGSGTGAAANGINLPEIPGGVLKLEVNIPDFNQSSEGTMIQDLWKEKMEAYLGVQLDITWTRTAWVDFRETEKVPLQAGKIVDISTQSIGTGLNEFGEDGTVLNLADYMDYMVYYPQYMAATNGGEDFAKNEDGSMYYFMDGFYNPQNIEGAQSFTAFAYRFDILKDNDLQPAATLDEFTQLCADIKAGIDSGDIDSQYVIMNSTKDYSLYRGFVGIFHTWDVLYYNGSEWVFGPIEDNFREMLKYLNGLYEAGYIDPEFGTAVTDAANVKATTGVAVICPTLWSGSVTSWNTATDNENMEWGLAYLPEGPYGTSWKWGSRQGGKSLSNGMGIYISAETEYPEYAVAMIDYQYSDEMVELLNWGVEGETYVVENGTKSFVDSIMNPAEAEATAATESAKYGLMSSSVCRSGIPFTPIDYDAMLLTSAAAQSWWNANDGYYSGDYWVESSKIGGPDSAAPYDRPPVTYLTPEEQAMRGQLSYGGVCENRVKELGLQFITGEKDIDNDSDWEAYITDVKSQTDEDFDAILETLNSKTVK